MLDKLFGGSSAVEVVFLESGLDLEGQLRRLNPRKKRPWYKKLPRGQVLIMGVVLGASVACLALLVVLSQVILPQLAGG